MRKNLLFTAAILAAGPAVAGNVAVVPVGPVVTVPAPVVGDWTGPYVGLQLGSGSADMWTGNTLTPLSGGVYGIHAGYNFDLGKIVLGAEIDYNDASISGNFDGAAEITSIAHLKARVGVDLGKVLVYGVGGVAYVDMELFGGTSKFSDNGAFYGIGVEYLISDKWSAGVEYLHHNFEPFDGSFFDLEIDTIQARASYHF